MTVFRTGPTYGFVIVFASTRKLRVLILTTSRISSFPLDFLKIQDDEISVKTQSVRCLFSFSLLITNDKTIVKIIHGMSAALFSSGQMLCIPFHDEKIFV